MRLAILADIHGNLLALEAVLADLEARGGADATVVAGDLCLAGPRPLEALERVRALDCPVIQGNTDRDLAAAPEATADGDDAELLAWTRERLGEDALAYLRTLPLAHRVEAPEGGDVVLIVHANPRNLDDPLRPLAPEGEIEPFLADVAPDVTTIAFGHLHIPYTRRVGRFLLADCSSVGLPKDGDRRAAYGLLTWQPGGGDGAGEWAVELRRVEYPVDETVAQLREADPPGVAGLVRTLLRARYPNMTAAQGGRAPRRAPAASPAGATEGADADLIGQPAPDAEAKQAASPAHGAAEPPATPPVAPPVDPLGTAAALAAAAVALPPGADALDPARALPAGADPPLALPAEVGQGEAPAAAGGVAAGPGERAIPVGTEPAAVEAAALAMEEAAAGGPAAPVVPPPLAEEALPFIAGPEAVAAATLAEAAGSEVLPTPGDGAPAPAGEPDDEKAERRERKARRKEAKEAKRATKRAVTPDLDPAEPFGPAISTILAARLGTVLAFEGSVRAGEDPEAVHDMRVGIRRLRAALDAAAPFSKPKAFRRQERRVKALADALGAVRDADVLLEFLRDRLGAAGEEERPGLARLIAAIEAEREDDRVALLAALDRLPEDDFAGGFERFARKLRKENKPTGAVARRALAASVAKFAGRADAFDDPEDAEELHRLRIAAKRLRYTLELFGTALGDETPGLIEELKGLQEGLGTIHDRDVLAELLVEERIDAATREADALSDAALDADPRAERLAAVRERLGGPESFAATAPGIYGLLADVADERRATFNELHARWQMAEADGFLDRLNRLAGAEARAGTRDAE